ncbi:septal ring lytic transglycosylase RlpA family lipoprotein [Sphingopyxis lindanitolerans]|uniref:Endolytic peptidoglycan transglycosylase RlpA n=1 Tax=Sphingopyxis lindanitolerans TaxID=2054227 RepID=A0A2S8B8S7_9SPHN|nr:septal ring lytic transglycosylase RlpA family protein [Sphingopyxis lindanitolerans]PQM28812.1 septal ring lytic transglycosylase RlpA family lipoprotein [Sphingopyxis lindanitolerans]
MRAFSAMLMPLLLTVSAAAQEVEIADDSAIGIDAETEIDGGMASYYGSELAGNRTASGERFDPSQFTAAHRSLPFGSKVRVTNTSNGDSVIVRINDRGPFSRGRVIDVSQAAAREIGLQRSGIARVKLALLNDD